MIEEPEGAMNAGGEALVSDTFPPVQAAIPLKGQRRDAAEHRQVILETARRLFSSEGVEQVSMHQIASEAHVGQGTLYRRFAHKGDLCQVLLNDSGMRFQTAVLAYLEHVEVSVPVRERIYAVLLQIIDYTEENESLLYAILASSWGERQQQLYTNPFYAWIRQVILVLLHQGVQNKEFPEQDLEYIVDVVLSPLSVDLYHYQRQVRGLSQQRIAAGLRQFLLHGLG